MSFAEWLRASAKNYRRFSPLEATKYTAAEFATGIGRRVGKHVTYGEPYWDDEWDVLVILDACRVDLMREVLPDYDYLPNQIQVRTSPASQSREFLERHTQPKYLREMARTALVSGNAFTRESFVQADDWATIDEVWRHSWNDEHGTVLARSVTDAAIRQHRNGDHERLIAWYLQPHVPFVTAEWSDGFDRKEGFGDPGEHDDGKSVWYQLRDGELAKQKLWNAYQTNLRYVLNDVRLLIENVDGKVVVTSDHGNAIGEYGIYGHPIYSWAPILKRVMWIELHASDKRTHDPEPEPTAESETTVEERLRALGYTDNATNGGDDT